MNKSVIPVKLGMTGCTTCVDVSPFGKRGLMGMLPYPEVDRQMQEVLVKRVETEAEMEAAIGVRFRVFVSEQGVPPEEELDEADATATHAIALSGGAVIGTGRLLRRDETTAIIGRMAVDTAWRRKGVGGQILLFLEEEARAQRLQQSILHAQEYVKSFYASHGYTEQGDTFLEVNIPHIEMRKGL